MYAGPLQASEMLGTMDTLSQGTDDTFCRAGRCAGG